jgi:hypothetical protein
MGCSMVFLASASHGLADALDHARGHDGPGLHVQELVFDGRASGIDDKHLHD